MKTPRLILGLALAIAATMSAVAEEPMPPMPAMADTAIFMHGVLDQFESRTDAFRWSGEAWVGGDRDKLWLKSEGFVLGRGNVEDGRHELLYDRAISAYADLQAGVRVDWDSGAGRTWAALGVHGMAPLFFNYEATAYFGDRGRAAARLAVSHDIALTQRTILQPLVELNFYSKSDPTRGLGSGLSDIDTGLRLRYEIARKIAPYVGIAYAGKFGETAQMARRAGDTTGGVHFVFGIRSWF